MLENLAKKILLKLAEIAYPDRKVNVVKIGKRFFIVQGDETGCNNYLLEGKYSYDEVITLNALTGEHCTFGFCHEIGPVAFIGHFASCLESGYFKYHVHEYGKYPNGREGYFKVYSDEEAKNISNYTVYGSRGAESVATMAPIAKVTYVYDSRYKSKELWTRDKKDKVLAMDLKLSGKYSFDEAKQLATNSEFDRKSSGGDCYPVQFAIVDGNEYVGIINLSEYDDEYEFRGVWEYGCDRPNTQKLHFLSIEEAKKINEFSLYVYLYPYRLKMDKFSIEKKDRTFDPRFNFRQSNSTDYRLERIHN